MSDGPYRGLPMSRAWKKVAKWAYNSNFDCDQVAELMSQVVVSDFRKEFPSSLITFLKKEFDRREGFLFPNLRAQPLVELDQTMDGSSIRRLLLTCANQELTTGRGGEQGLINAMKSATSDWMLRAARMMEEHYRRDIDSKMPNAVNVRDRIEEAIQRVTIDDVVQRILGHQPIRSSRVHRSSRLDDGVPLR